MRIESCCRGRADGKDAGECTAYAASHPSTVVVDKGGQLVAQREFPRGGVTYSLALPPDRYTVRYSSSTLSVPSFSVVVTSVGVAHVPDVMCF